MLSKKKKIIIVSVFCLLLAVTGALNIILNNNILRADTVNTVTTASFFSTYRTDRKDTRDQQILYLDAIIASSSSSAEAKTSAEAKKQEIVSLMDQELVLEGLIRAKGFDDVIVSTSTKTINVIVKSAELTSAEVAQIYDIIKTQTSYLIDNIKIIPVE